LLGDDATPVLLGSQRSLEGTQQERLNCRKKGSPAGRTPMFSSCGIDCDDFGERIDRDSHQKRCDELDAEILFYRKFHIKYKFHREDRDGITVHEKINAPFCVKEEYCHDLITRNICHDFGVMYAQGILESGGEGYSSCEAVDEGCSSSLLIGMNNTGGLLVGIVVGVIIFVIVMGW
jgi:hypothetical protein